MGNDPVKQPTIAYMSEINKFLIAYGARSLSEQDLCPIDINIYAGIPNNGKFNSKTEVVRNPFMRGVYPLDAIEPSFLTVTYELRSS